MRFLHTADWHLGRTLHGERLTEEQAALLDQVVAAVQDTKPDAVVVAGDIYDRAVPPPEAVALLDETLSRLVLGCRKPVILIAGNHDSPDRLGFGSRLLASQGLHVAGTLNAEAMRIEFSDQYGTVEFFALPYAEPPVVRMALSDDKIEGHDAAMRAIICRLPQISKGGRRVLVAHAFVGGGAESESERPLSVGGAGTVDAACFHEFSYVALGHLHRPQVIRERVCYSGSLMKYSFSEASDRKAMQLVELDGQGRCHLETIPLTPRRDIRRVKGLLRDLLEHPPADGRDDYLEITLLDEGAVNDALARLRAVYPRTLTVLRPERMPRESARKISGDHRKLTDLELFAQFYDQMTNTPLSPEQQAVLRATLERLQLREREAIA